MKNPMNISTAAAKTFHAHLNKINSVRIEKITSTSNNTKRMVVMKYLIETGSLALPCDSIPHSQLESFSLFFLF